MRNGQSKAYVRERVRTAGVVMKWVWGIGKDWERRIWLWDASVDSPGIRSGDMGLEGMEGDGGSIGKVSEVDTRSGLVYTRIHGEGRDSEIQAEHKSWGKNMGTRKKTMGREGKRTNKELLGVIDDEGGGRKGVVKLEEGEKGIS
ncbi:hypothetical protein WN55_02576 [Dufourea novaeangliae]|uniref:Uncharacterized protein n=1 Tax=Dufourea novaeangliae TaxID=178035 RepID=A0A154PHQ9_DUFNO|nr:hypothetical protein WN55_02576 [Dufourea novaeangliae]